MYVLDLGEVGGSQVGVVGGKGAQLGELARIEGVDVPAGFCVTTGAFRRAVAGIGRGLGAELPMPDDVAAAIGVALARYGEHEAYAVRSSATAEDSPTASFAGQHDTFLNISGADAIVEHVRRVWASLFTERAVAYRRRNDLDHSTAQMAVVVQRMVAADASGVLFTADPVTSNRTVVSVEAAPGLGEALVSGRVNTDVATVRDGAITAYAQRHERRVLTDDQVLHLAHLGRRIEARFGRPQDIEWCLAGDEVAIVQSRPITTLFPIPASRDDDPHVYVSVGHQQMMTDAMKPLGLSLFQLTAMAPMHAAGGRLFVDVAPRLTSPTTRDAVMTALGKSDPLIGDALQTLLDRGDVIPPAPEDDGPAAAPTPTPAAAPAAAPAPIATDPAIVAALIAAGQDSIATLRRDIRALSGPALLDFILADIQELKRIAFDPRSMQVIMAAMEATWWLNDQLEEWLGETNAADTLTQSVPGNITSEMGLALLDVADAIRPHPEVVAALRDVAVNAEDDTFLDDFATLAGGPRARDAIRAFLDRYGMRCVGEIDITRPRWSERPATLVPLLLGNIDNFAQGAGPRRFEHGRRQALAKQHELLDRLRALPDGDSRAAKTERMIDRVRTFSGYREYPKYSIISRYWVYKQALLREADRLTQTGALGTKDDIFFLTFAELHDLTRTGAAADPTLLAHRRGTFKADQSLTPPRVLTSDGEVVAGAYRRDDAPPGALVGLAVSAGTVEGRARVVLDLAAANLEPGDILVTTFTDPSWSPLFVAAGGLVTEVGGLMTHGAVIAREYGLPAVVGVEHATRAIRDGQRIRVHGTDGYVELLD
jgi:pyruvate,water dikinase